MKNIFLLSCISLVTLFLSAQLPTASEIKTRELFGSIRSGNSEDLDKLLTGSASANDSLNDYSALMAATMSGTVDQMKILISHGASVNYQNKTGLTALWLAVPDIAKTKLLLDNGADANHQVEGFGVLAKLASIPGTMPVFRLLMSYGADLKKTASDNTLLYNAASSGDTAVLGLLIDNGFKLNDTTFFGDFPINNALLFRQFPSLKMLVDHGADINVQPMNLINFDALVGFTPLMNAALSDDQQSFFYLLDHGANTNSKNKKGYTALILLQQSEAPDDLDMTKALLEHGAQAAYKAPDGTDALYYALRKGRTTTVELLEKYAKK